MSCFKDAGFQRGVSVAGTDINANPDATIGRASRRIGLETVLHRVRQGFTV
jgi:hypothetical protein